MGTGTGMAPASCHCSAGGFCTHVENNYVTGFHHYNKEKEEFSECVTSIESKKVPGLRTVKLLSAVGCCWRIRSFIQLGRMTEGV